MRSVGERKRMTCEVELKFVLPAKCNLDEAILRKRVEEHWHEIVKGLCDSCTLNRGRGGD